MFGVFIPAIKFDYLFLDIFQSFYWFVTLIFDKFTPSPLNICFKKCFKLLFSPFRRKKEVSEELKYVVLFFFCTLINRPLGGEAVA